MTGGRDKSTVLLTAEEQHAVPKGRARRFGKFARLAGGVAGNMLAHGAAQLATGKRPRAKDLLLTPKNAMRLIECLLLEQSIVYCYEKIMPICASHL